MIRKERPPLINRSNLLRVVWTSALHDILVTPKGDLKYKAVRRGNSKLSQWAVPMSSLSRARLARISLNVYWEGLPPGSLHDKTHRHVRT